MGLQRCLETLEIARGDDRRRLARADWSRVSDAGLDRLAPPPGLGRIVVIFPEARSTEALVAYDAACLAGDTERQAVIIRQETGETLNPR